MKIELAHLEVALYKSEDRRWSASDLKLPPGFDFDSGGQRRNVPQTLKRRSFKTIPHYQFEPDFARMAVVHTFA
jgi:hypothetical protein